MSPKIGEVDGIEISIKSSEHGNPHIHAWYQGEKAKVFIETLGVEGGGLPPSENEKIKEMDSRQTGNTYSNSGTKSSIHRRITDYERDNRSHT